MVAVEENVDGDMGFDQMRHSRLLHRVLNDRQPWTICHIRSTEYEIYKKQKKRKKYKNKK